MKYSEWKRLLNARHGKFGEVMHLQAESIQLDTYPRVEYLWHLSPRKNRQSINCQGIDPGFCRGPLVCIWLTAQPQRVGFLSHLQRSHALPIERFDLYVCDVTDVPVARHGRHGMYRYSGRLWGSSIYLLGQLGTLKPSEQLLIATYSPFSLPHHNVYARSIVPPGVG